MLHVSDAACDMHRLLDRQIAKQGLQLSGPPAAAGAIPAGQLLQALLVACYNVRPLQLLLLVSPGAQAPAS